MSLLNIAWRVFAAVTFVVAAPNVMAQFKELPNGPTYHPFADPLEFDPDWQFFAPVDVEYLSELSPRKRANTGWYATYDRTYLWMSRPNVEQSAANGDFGWGNRFDFGFMTDKDSGWNFSFRNMGGPNVYDRVWQERIDRVNTADTGDPANAIFPSLDRNDPQLLERVYVLGDSLNVASLTNFEINKTWRKRPYRYGGILEPMIGFKYSTFNDFAMNQEYSLIADQITDPTTPVTPFQTERLISFETDIKNQMVGGQLGLRYLNHYNRWTLSGEFRTFSMANFQHRSFARKQYTTQYAGVPAIGVGTTINEFDVGHVYEDNTEFVLGFEARAEAAYQLTRYIQVRGGIDVINFARGIWRGANPNNFESLANQTVEDPNQRDIIHQHSQDVQIAGFTFGLTLNR